MSQQDQERVTKIISLLIPHLSWRMLGVMVAVPTAIIATVTIFGWLFTMTSFMQGVNHVVTRFPAVDSDFHVAKSELRDVAGSLSEVKDTLRNDGYRFFRP